MTAPDPAAIAKGLSGPTRIAILRLSSEWTTDILPRGWARRGVEPLIEIQPGTSARRLTYLGLAVRAHLENIHD